MTKGTYVVGESVGPSKDGSFRSMLCAMLVFFAICVILILAAWPWNKSGQVRNPKDDSEVIDENYDNEYEKLIQGKDKPTTTRKPRITKLTTRPPVVIPRDATTTQAPKETESVEIITDENGEDVDLPPKDIKTSTTTTTTTTTAPKIVVPTTTSTTTTTTTTALPPLQTLPTTTNAPPKPLIPIISDTSEEPSTTTESYQYSSEDSESTSESTPDTSSTSQEPSEVAHTVTSTDIPSTSETRDAEFATWSTTEDTTTQGPFELTSPDYTTEYSTETTTFTSELPSSNENEFENIISTTDISTSSLDYITSTPWASTEESTSENYSESTSENYSESTSVYYSTSEDYSESTNDNYSESSTTELPLIDIRSKNDRTQSSTTEEPLEETKNPFETDGTSITNVHDYDDEVEEEDEAEKEKKEIKDDKEKNEEQELKFQRLRINNANVCETGGCKHVASHMLNKMNHSADACEDFYDYACGGENSGDKQNEENLGRIAEKLWQISSSSSPSYLLTFRKYYDSCVRFHYEFNYEQRLKGAKDILHTVSRLYDRTQQIPEEMTLTELLTRLLLVDSAPLFDISVDADKQSRRFVFQMTPAKQSSLLEDESLMTKSQKQCFQTIRKMFSRNLIDMNALYNKYLDCQSNYTAYLNSMEQAVNAFGDFTHMEPYNITWHIQNLRTTIEWDVLPKITAPGEHLADNDLPPPGKLKFDLVNKKYKVMKVAEMKLQFPLVDWSVLLSRLVGKPVDDEQPVQVYFDGYFKSLFKHLQQLPVWQVHNALLTMFAHDLYNNLVISVPSDTQEDFCLRQSTRLLKEISSAMYMDTWLDRDITLAAKQVDDTFKQIKSKLSESVQVAEWLDDSARIVIMMKISKMQLISESGATVWTPALLAERVKDVFDESTTNYQDHAIALLKRHRKLLYGLWGEDVQDPKNIWWYYVTPYSTSPVSIYALNSVVIPIGMILQSPKNMPRYISLATVGYAVAKEIGRHFDTSGVLYDMKLDGDAKATYKATKQCHVNKYSMSMSHQSGSKIYSYQVDPTLTLNEIIVEDFAAKLVSDMSVDVMNDQLMPWIANSFSREKIFFLAMAQEHCKRFSNEDFFVQLFEGDRLPPAMLMKSFFGNLNMFTSSFDCPDGSGMNHPVKCQQFPEFSKEVDYSYLYP